MHKPHLRFRGSELLSELLCSTLLMPHAQEVQRRIQPIQIAQRHFPRGVAFQIVAVHRPRCLPAETHFVQLFCPDIREVQACSNGIFRESGVMLQPADALFRHREQQFAVAHNARRRIMHLRIINPQRQHSSSVSPHTSSWLLVILAGILPGSPRKVIVACRSHKSRMPRLLLCALSSQVVHSTSSLGHRCTVEQVSGLVRYSELLYYGNALVVLRLRCRLQHSRFRVRCLPSR